MLNVRCKTSNVVNAVGSLASHKTTLSKWRRWLNGPVCVAYTASSSCTLASSLSSSKREGNGSTRSILEDSVIAMRSCESIEIDSFSEAIDSIWISTTSGESAITECFSVWVMFDLDLPVTASFSSEGSMKSLAFDLYMLGRRVGRSMPAWDFVLTTGTIFSFVPRLACVHFPSHGREISVNEILRCKDGNGYFSRVFDTVSIHALWTRDFSFLALDDLCFSLGREAAPMLWLFVSLRGDILSTRCSTSSQQRRPHNQRHCWVLKPRPTKIESLENC